MLEVRKVHCLSNRHVVSQDGTDVAELVRSRWCTRAEFTLKGRTFQARKQGLFRCTYALMEGDSVVVEARRPSSWRSRLVFQFEGRQFEIANRSWYSAQLAVKLDGTVVGSIGAKGFLATRLFVDLPDTLPLSVQIFIAWLAMVQRDESAAAVGAPGPT